MFKKTFITASLIMMGLMPILPAFAAENSVYIKPVINVDDAIEAKKGTIFDASQSFIAETDREIKYLWDFGDGNRNEGTEVLHAYKEPGRYTVKLAVDDGLNQAESYLEIFAYRKQIILITDQSENANRVQRLKDFAEKEGVFIRVVESFGSTTEFISEEILAKKLTETAKNLQKTEQILIWTNENAGINALSRYIQGKTEKKNTLEQKTLIVISSDISSSKNRIQNQFNLLNPREIIVAKEGAIDLLIESSTNKNFLENLEKRGYEFELVTQKSGQLRPWNFMSYFVNILINKGIPDNTIALLLLLPVIATVVAFLKQVVGITTFGIYTPSIITLSFFIIGIELGLLTLITAIIIGTLVRPILSRVRMLFIPKMAILITIVSLALLLILIFSIYLGLFSAEFLSIAIFPMLILSTLVEKFISTKSDKGLSTATILMAETVLASIIAYFVAGGEIDLGLFSLKFEFIKHMMLTYPEIVFLLIFINILLGKWSGLRVLERIRFREIFRHIEE